MSSSTPAVDIVRLQQSHAALEAEVARLRQRLAAVEGSDSKQAHHATSGNEHNDLKSTTESPASQPSAPHAAPSSRYTPTHTLSNSAIARYGRQMLVREFGSVGQQYISAARVCIIGAGGLGSPVALYLAAAGIGHITIIDNDTVDISNLHRQVIHTEAKLGQSKAESARAACLAINSSISVTAITASFNHLTATQLAAAHDLLVDCSDNVATRYLINDAAVLHNIPVVSGSALRLEGQCTVYHYNDGPCYRCLFPHPPPAATVTNCSEGGVIGTTVGIIGSIQANEVLKLVCLLKWRQFAAECPFTFTTLSGQLLLFDGFTPSFRSVRIRQKNAQCAVCGDKPTVQLADIQSPTYAALLGPMHDQPVQCKLGTRNTAMEDSVAYIAEQADSVTVTEYEKVRQSNTPHVLLDVRDATQWSICRLPNAVHMPLSTLKANVDVLQQHMQELQPQSSSPASVFVVCRRGVDSLRAVQLLRNVLQPDQTVHISNIEGGLLAYTQQVDSSFPIY